MWEEDKKGMEKGKGRGRRKGGMKGKSGRKVRREEAHSQRVGEPKHECKGMNEGSW